jgi:hypothetical protein
MNKVVKVFTVNRITNDKNISGSGRILDGVVFHTGQVVVCWRTDIEAANHGVSSIGIYKNWEEFNFLHIKSHPEYVSKVEFKEIEF